MDELIASLQKEPPPLRLQERFDTWLAQNPTFAAAYNVANPKEKEAFIKMFVDATNLEWVSDFSYKQGLALEEATAVIKEQQIVSKEAYDQQDKSIARLRRDVEQRI